MNNMTQNLYMYTTSAEIVEFTESSSQSIFVISTPMPFRIFKGVRKSVLWSVKTGKGSEAH